MKISAVSHKNQPWIAHQLLDDFRIEDVWQLPIAVKEEDNVDKILEAFVLAIAQIGKKGVAGQLFKLRTWLGKIFHWENEPVTRANVKPGLIKIRYAMLEKRSPDDLPKGGFDHFDLVYQLNNESLLEIENKTVQAALHFGKISNGDKLSAQMAIYVKPNGWFGDAYMLAIKPFRHFIVYPTLLKALARQWQLSTKA